MAKTVEFLVRLPKDLHDALSKRAYEEDRPKAVLVRRAIEQMLAKPSKP